MSEPESIEIDSGWEDLARAQRGSREAWERLFALHSPRLFRMAALLTGSPDAARDCVQETFSRLLHAAIRHRESSLRAYLSTITYRLAVRESLRMVKRGSVGDLDPPSGDPSPLDQVIVDEQQRGVCAVLRSLSTAHQEILVLRFYGEHSYEEIAGITGVPLGTVKSRIFHAVKSARIELNKRGIV